MLRLCKNTTKHTTLFIYIYIYIPILLDPTDDDENSGNLLILCLRHFSFFTVFQPSQLVCPISSPADGIRMDRQTPRMICKHTYIIYSYTYKNYQIDNLSNFTQIPDSLLVRYTPINPISIAPIVVPQL